VVLLRFPEALVSAAEPLPAGLPCLTLSDLTESHLQARLADLMAEHGPVGAFIHLNPISRGELFSEKEKSLVEGLFLLAKHLQPVLTAAGAEGRAAFVTATRLDGMLGLSGADFGVIAGGLNGLTKTLALEWESVCCRAVDLDPALSAEAVAEAMRVELHDPDRRRVEVGVSARGRVGMGSKT